MSFMYVRDGGGAWIFNIPGGAIEPNGNTSHQTTLTLGTLVILRAKFHVASSLLSVLQIAILMLA